MKSTFENWLAPMSILLLGFLSALLLPAPSPGPELTARMMSLFHFSDLNQFYTFVLCLWFLVLGTMEFFVLRFLWRRFGKV
ncbi:DUF1158 family protein [Mixta hanseatica]|uniref:DUF1158 domain-containing protein n=1 Tax=Mixta hanseatica TaxID=2872648 RepID=A0ABY4RBZ2_9GAMM|nr:DUF1158 family protein [Mixta hanseatica]UQY44296.1 DUF1158 domain-containing protein [Mixta hanseatica]